MNKIALVLTVWLAAVMPALAGARAAPLRSPVPNVLCDRYVCANDRGISRALTARYLGSRAAARAFSQGGFDPTEFTFANGVFCDVKARLCRQDRYFGTDGQRSGAVSKRYTRLLFGR